MSKKIKKIMEDINALEVDDAIKKVFTDSLDELNEEHKEEIIDTKTRLNEGFKVEREEFTEKESGYAKEIAKLKDVEQPKPDQALVDRLAVVEKENAANKELAQKTEEKRILSVIDAELLDIFKDSIDPKMMVELNRNRVKLVDGKVYSNDADMLNAEQLSEKAKADKPHMYKASGVGGSGASGSGGRTPANGDYYSMDEINSMEESTMIANLDKVNKSAEFHAKNK